MLWPTICWHLNFNFTRQSRLQDNIYIYDSKTDPFTNCTVLSEWKESSFFCGFCLILLIIIQYVETFVWWHGSLSQTIFVKGNFFLSCWFHMRWLVISQNFSIGKKNLPSNLGWARKKSINIHRHFIYDIFTFLYENLFCVGISNWRLKKSQNK